jgi:3-oxoacyl-[acyl-carrier protein] reductase
MTEEPPNMPLQGKVVLVTGASRGIGKAIAERLGRDGASVVVNYYTNRPEADERARADEVVRAIGQNGGAAVVAEADVADAQQLRSLFDLAERQFSGLDILVTNAAAWRFGSLADLTDEDFDVVFNTNARGTFIALHEAANRLRDGGRIVAISAGLALMPRPDTGIYGASKAAINHLVRVLAHELGSRQITVNSVMPGATNTDAMREGQGDVSSGDTIVTFDSEIALTPLGRLGEPEDIADIVAFLASDQGRWVTGQLIGAGGGMF